MSTIIREGATLDEIIEALSYELASPTSVFPYNTDRQVVLSFGTLHRILSAIRKEIKKQSNQVKETTKDE